MAKEANRLTYGREGFIKSEDKEKPAAWGTPPESGGCDE